MLAIKNEASERARPERPGNQRRLAQLGLEGGRLSLELGGSRREIFDDLAGEDVR